jgi:transposase-like protein
MKDDLFKWKHHRSEIILLSVRWYLKYPLSYRDIEEIVGERGLCVRHTTIMRWVQEYSPIIEQRIRRHLSRTNDSWRMDETYLKVNGVDHYLYRAVDSNGETIDFLVSQLRDKDAAKRFLRKALAASHNRVPRVITTDKAPATEVAIAESIYHNELPVTVLHRQCKYLNNIVEQDHRFIKRICKPMLGFKSYPSACRTIAGIEAMHMIRKRQAGPLTPRQGGGFHPSCHDDWVISIG